MGTWGPGIYQNDTSADIKDFFIKYLKQGSSKEDVTKRIIEEFSCEMEDEPVNFWCALADTQWKLGMLLEDVKLCALRSIDCSSDLESWEEENPKNSKKRFEILAELKNKLNSPMPKEKEVKPEKIFRCEWAIGDVYGFEVEYEELKKLGFRWIVIRKVGERSWYPEHIIPIVHVKFSRCETLPNNGKEYDDLEYIQVMYDDGYLMSIAMTSKRNIPKKLIFLGNFANVKLPENVIDSTTDRPMLWKTMQKELYSTYAYFVLKLPYTPPYKK